MTKMLSVKSRVEKPHTTSATARVIPLPLPMLLDTCMSFGRLRKDGRIRDSIQNGHRSMRLKRAREEPSQSLN